VIGHDWKIEIPLSSPKQPQGFGNNRLLTPNGINEIGDLTTMATMCVATIGSVFFIAGPLQRAHAVSPNDALTREFAHDPNDCWIRCYGQNQTTT
jgi:hypothetical protein